MSVVRLVSIFPQLDKTAELLSLLEEGAKASPGLGLSQNIFGEVPTLTTTKVFDSLEDLEKDRSDPSNIARRAKIGPLSRQASVIRLLSPIVPPTETMNSNLRFTQRAVFFPTSQGNDAVRDAVEEFAKGQQANGRPFFRMAQVLFAHDDPAFTAGDSYETLAELENVTRQRTEAVAELRAKLGSNIARPTIQRIQEIIVPANA